MFAVPHRFLYPTSFWPAAGRSRFLATFRRIALGGLARSEDGKFGDVLLADALTSYARPLSELYIALTMMWRRQGTDSVDRSSMVAVPLLLAVPFAIRLRQCITDNQPYNALKYATAFPAILFSTLLRAESLGAWRGLIGYLWILAALTNALYSFYWDVTCDWDLTLLTKPVGDRKCTLSLAYSRAANSQGALLTLHFQRSIRTPSKAELLGHSLLFHDCSRSRSALCLGFQALTASRALLRYRGRYLHSRAIGSSQTIPLGVF